MEKNRNELLLQSVKHTSQENISSEIFNCQMLLKVKIIEYIIECLDMY